MEVWIYQLDLPMMEGDITRLTPFAVRDDFISVIWNRRYFEPGDFELHLPGAIEGLEADYYREYIVWLPKHVEAGVVEDVQITYDESTETVLKGRMLSSEMDRHLFTGASANQTYQEVMVGVINDFIANRGHFWHGTTPTDASDKLTCQFTLKETLTVMERLSRASNIGFRVRPVFDEQRFYIDLYRGADHGSASSDQVVFSRAMQNIKSISYRDNTELFKNIAIVGGDGEGVSRIYRAVRACDELDYMTEPNLRYLFVDAKDINRDDEAFTTEQDYLDALDERGREKLSEQVRSTSWDVEVYPDITYRYGIDYDLGDIVYLEGAGNMRITEASEVYEHKGREVTLTFGTPLPTTLDLEDD